MDPWAPINGISLERYAALAAEVDGTQDPEKQAEIVGGLGVARADWEAAKAGWTARMQDVSLMGQVATRFMPLYQAALAKKAPGAAHAAAQPNPYAQQAAYAQPNPHAQQAASAQPNPYAQPAAWNAQAQSAGAQLGNALNAFGSALGSFVDSAVGGYSIGARVAVQWSDGNRYPGTVTNLGNGQIEVAFPDGRRMWIPQQYVSAIY